MAKIEELAGAEFDVHDGTCGWANGSVEMRHYHDAEWGAPSHDDRHLFEMLTLEGAQAGLSWLTVLRRRDGYRRAFDGFDPAHIASWDDEQLLALMDDDGIIRNRAKLLSTRTNARGILALAEGGQSFADYLWGWVDGAPVINHPRELGELVASTPLSDAISKDLKKRGFAFVGTTIVYALLEAVGVVDDHLDGCPRKGAGQS